MVDVPLLIETFLRRFSATQSLFTLLEVRTHERFVLLLNWHNDRSVERTNERTNDRTSGTHAIAIEKRHDFVRSLHIWGVNIVTVIFDFHFDCKVNKRPMKRFAAIKSQP